MLVDLKRAREKGLQNYCSDDFVVYLMDDTPGTIEEAYSSLGADYLKEATRGGLGLAQRLGPLCGLNT